MILSFPRRVFYPWVASVGSLGFSQNFSAFFFFPLLWGFPFSNPVWWGAFRGPWGNFGEFFGPHFFLRCGPHSIGGTTPPCFPFCTRFSHSFFLHFWRPSLLISSRVIHLGRRGNLKGTPPKMGGAPLITPVFPSVERFWSPQERVLWTKEALFGGAL